MSDDEHSDPATDAEQRPLTAMTYASGFRIGAVVEPDGTIRTVHEATGVENADVSKFAGMPLSEVAGSGARGEARAQEWIDRLALLRKSDQPMRFDDLRPDMPDGPRSVRTTVTPVRSADGTLEAFVLAMHDRSEQIEVERKVREQEELLRSALDVTGLGSFAMYIRERRFDSDARYREIFGYDPHPEVVSGGVMALLEPLHVDDRERVGETFMRAFRGKQGVTYQEEYRIWARRPNGHRELRRVWVMSRVEVDEQGPRRILGVVDDVTDRRREEELRIRMQKREALGTLAGGLAHDFNNVISAILSNAHVAAVEVKSGADPSTSIAEISRGAKRAGELVRRLLDVSRDHEPERRPIDLGAVAEDACALVRPTIPPRISLEVDPGTGEPELLGDPSQLHQVVMNLVTNAAQAIGNREGRISVSVERKTVDGSAGGTGTGVDPGDYLRLCVSDDGAGIPEDALPRIFDPFFTTKEQGEGTGLGLAAAQSIVRGHGGQITVESHVGSGTSVAVFLPLDAPREEPEVSPPKRDRTERIDGGGNGELRVLFVDDEPSLAMLAERALPHHGCAVRAFTEPVEALSAFSAAPAEFDALVTDLAMPGLSGFELIAAAREVRPDLPVVLTSGFLTEDSKVEAARLAVDRVVPKPCPIDELAAAVHDITRPD